MRACRPSPVTNSRHVLRAGSKRWTRMITIYGIKNCDTMKKARAWLDGQGVDYSFHDYKATGIDRASLEGWVKQHGWETVLNRAGTTFRGCPMPTSRGSTPQGDRPDAGPAFDDQAPGSRSGQGPHGRRLQAGDLRGRARLKARGLSPYRKGGAGSLAHPFRTRPLCATSRAMTVQPNISEPLALQPGPTDFTFAVHARDGAARTGEIRMPRGVIRTPAFMPVGTPATVKGCIPIRSGARRRYRARQHLPPDAAAGRRARRRARRPAQVHELAAPDPDRLRRLPGLSLANLRKINEHGVTFQSHIDGSKHMLSPERSVEIQNLLGSDIAMQLDECVSLPATTRSRAGDAAVAALGRALQDGLRQPGGQGAVRHRPGRRGPGICASRAPANSPPWTSRATPSAGSRSASRRT